MILSNKYSELGYNLNKLRDLCHREQVNNGWWKEERNDGELIALMHSELSEALECLRTTDADEPIEYELGDCIIRILDYCGARGLDIGSAVLNKLEKNKRRGHRHGNKAF